MRPVSGQEAQCLLRLSLKYDFSFKHLFLNEIVRRHFISDALRIPLEAIKEVRILSLSKYLRLLHEARLKEIRDRDAREDYVRREGWNAGHSEGEDRLNRLYSRLIADSRFKDLERSVKDKKYREQLYREYGIS